MNDAAGVNLAGGGWHFLGASLTAPTNAAFVSGYIYVPNRAAAIVGTNFVEAAAEPGATLGASWTQNTQDRPTNLAALVGSEGINNAAVSIGSNGALSGAGGGQVSLPGLGFAGDLAATAADNIIVNASLASLTAASWTVSNVNVGGGGSFFPSPGVFYTDVNGAYLFANASDAAPFPVTEGRTYFLSGSLYSQDFAANKIHWEIEWLKADGSTISTSSGDFAASANFTLTKRATSVTAPALAAKAKLKFSWTQGNVGAGNTYFLSPRLATSEDAADVTKVATGPASTTLNYQSDATTLSTVIPKSVGGFELTPAGGTAYSSGVTWAATVISGTFSGTAPSATGTGAGTLVLNSGLDSAEAVVAMTPTYLGRAYAPAVIKVVKEVAQQAIGGGGGGAFAQDSDLDPISTTSFVPVSADLAIILSGSTATLAASGFVINDGIASRTAELKWQRESSPGTWTDTGSLVSKTVPPGDSRSFSVPASPGSLSGAQKFRLVGRMTTTAPGESMSFSGSASAQG